MLIKQLIEEAYQPEKIFESEEDFITKIKSVLRKVSFPRAKEVKSKSDRGFEQPTKFGYVYRYFNGSVTISFVGAEVRWISELMKSLSIEKINYHFNNKTETFLIKVSENVKSSEETYPEEVKEELKTNIYGVLGSVALSKTDIKKIIDSFNSTQKKIYNFLLNEGLITWSYIKVNSKFVYELSVKNEGEQHV